jgi:hypothetical protein
MTCCDWPKEICNFIERMKDMRPSKNVQSMQEPQKDLDSELMGQQEIQPNKKTPWQTPTVTEISRFDILALAPVPGPVEDATYYLKS